MPQPSLKLVPRDQIPDDLKPVYDSSLERTGFPTLVGAFANHPAIARWYFDRFYKDLFYNGDAGMRVDIRSKELLRLKLSKQHGCLFCNKSNTIDAAKVGITAEAIEAIFDYDSPHWSGKDRAVMRLADEMMLQNMDGYLSPELHAEMSQFFDDGELIELGFIAAVLTGMAKWIFTYDLVDREETCPVTRPAT